MTNTSLESVYKTQQAVNHYYENSFNDIAPSFAPIISTFALKRLFMGENLHPFRKAKLQDCSGNIKKRWYISFYVWDAKLNDLVRKREYSINSYKTVEERKAFAKQRIKVINDLFAEGYHIADKKSDEMIIDSMNSISLEESLLSILEIKKQNIRGKTYRNSKGALNSFLSWAKQNRLNNADVRYFNRNYAQQYLDFLLMDKKLAGSTINYKIRSLRTLFNNLLQRETITESPFSRIKSVKEIQKYKNEEFLLKMPSL